VFKIVSKKTKSLTKRVKSHVFEKVIQAFMILFGLSAVAIALAAVSYNSFSIEIAIILMMIIIVLLILAQTQILIRIYEQHED